MQNVSRRALIGSAIAIGTVGASCTQEFAGSPDQDLIAMGNQAHASFFKALALPDTVEADELYGVMTDGAERIVGLNASTLEGVKAKARALMVHLDVNQDCSDILPGADLHERLAWSLVKDILAL